MHSQNKLRLIASLVSGIVFGLGMAISGMTNTERVQGFLDLAGAWDPTLAFVMAGGMLVTFIGYQFILKKPAPLLGDAFHVPTRTDIDKPLLIGAILFGAGWGLVGYCPGPAIAGISYGYTATLTFVPTMIIGLLLAKPLGKLF
ncbi:hypothetical protein A9Q89_11730 [Gammaproteobacteria bacterium 53_120_T64]|nr:hypothetical protein A9Q89_11730 [Gammaproteobacteria bacterium 53_120_T64]